MKISIIIPAYNSERTLVNTIKYIFNSKITDFEIIIVDDFSTKKIKDYIKNNKVKIFRNKRNMGPSYSRNIGAQKAKGEILLFLDSDIYIKKNTLFKIIEIFKKKSIDVLVGLFDERTPNNDFFSNFYNLRMRKGLLDSLESIDFVYGAVFAVRKFAFDSVGGFNIKYKNASIEDLELGKRLFAKGYKIKLDKNLEVIHDKKFNFVRLLKNDFIRSLDRVDFISFKNLLKYKRFTHSSLGQIISVLLTPVLLISILIDIKFFIFFSNLFILLNLNYLIYFFKKKRFLFSLQSACFLFIDLTVAFIAIFYGIIRRIIEFNLYKKMQKIL
ncbi:glycosyltransferase family 2 protein [Candidatus Woesearchaeota archaeon]|nr:glycosyltransferase family 2 protein [Candidatus Woesearchaeota archaeon]